jgi:hypothetical protein
MRSAWNWLLAHAHATRVVLLVVLIAGGAVWGWYLWKNGGYTENAPPTPQFMEVYLETGANSAAVSVTSVITPVTAFGASGKSCAVESAGCDSAREYLTVRVTPPVITSAQGNEQPSQDVSWLLVTDTRPATGAHGWSKVQVSQPGKVQLTGFPTSGVWIYNGSIENGKPVSFEAQFDVHVVARPSDHLVIEMPALLNEANPQTWCGPEMQLSFNPPEPTQLAPDDVGGGCAIQPGQPGFSPATVLPFTGAISLFAPQDATSTEVLADSSGLRGYTLDSSDGATPIASGFDWTGSYQLQPGIYATNISSSGTVARRQLLLGVLIGLSLAALLALVQEFRHERKEAEPGPVEE